MNAAELARIHEAAFPDAPWSEATFSDLLAQPNIVFCHNDAAFVIGRVVADEAEILTIATAFDQLRKGHGAAILTDFLKLVRGAGAQKVYLEVAANNEAARALYQKMGFAQVGLRKGYYKRAEGAAVDALTLATAL